jgi:hypothetical protein
MHLVHRYSHNPRRFRRNKNPPIARHKPTTYGALRESNPNGVRVNSAYHGVPNKPTTHGVRNKSTTHGAANKPTNGMMKKSTNHDVQRDDFGFGAFDFDRFESNDALYEATAIDYSDEYDEFKIVGFECNDEEGHLQVSAFQRYDKCTGVYEEGITIEYESDDD